MGEIWNYTAWGSYIKTMISSGFSVKMKMRSEITAAKTQETLEQEKLCPKEQPDFLSTDPLFSHGLTPTTPIQIQQTAYMFQTDEWNIAAKSLIEEVKKQYPLPGQRPLRFICLIKQNQNQRMVSFHLYK